MIIARTDALRVTKSMEETAIRCRAYNAASADALMVLDLAPEQVAGLRAQIPDIPLALFVSPATQPPPLAQLDAAGFKLALYPFNTMAAVAESVTRLWTSLRETGSLDQDPARVAHLRNSVQDLIGGAERRAAAARPCDHKWLRYGGAPLRQFRRQGLDRHAVVLCARRSERLVGCA